MANKRITDVDYLESLNSNESFFVNQNNTLKQVNKSKVIFDIVNGGTGATTAAEALTNLGAMPKSGGEFTGNITFSEGAEIQFLYQGAPFNLSEILEGIGNNLVAVNNSLGTQVTYSLEGTVLTITTK